MTETRFYYLPIYPDKQSAVEADAQLDKLARLGRYNRLITLLLSVLLASANERYLLNIFTNES